MARRYRRRKQKLTPLTIIIGLLIIAFSAGVNNKKQPTQTVVDHATSSSANYGGLSKQDYQKLAQLTYQSAKPAYVEVNHNHSTLNPKAWVENRVIYAALDNLNRTSSSNTAFLEKRNLANGGYRQRQYIEPTGWHYNRRGGEELYNRGHLIAYSMSAGIDQAGNYSAANRVGDQNNPKNLFTQSAFSNQRVQTIFEQKVRDALARNQKVIYQATPIFRQQELMARGINLQAISLDGKLDFNVYLFNVQPGYQFNYDNGRARKDSTFKVPNPD